MTDVRSYRGNGHGRVSGPFAPRPQGGSDFLGALQEAVRENPLPAALIGMGVFWMFMGGSNVSLFGGGARKSLFGTAAQGAHQFTGAVQQGGASLGATVGGTIQGMAQPAWQAGSAAAGAMGDAAAVTADAASRTAARAADAAVSSYQTTTDMVSRAAETAANATTTAASAVQDTAAKFSTGLQRTLSDLFERQPLLLGAVGLAIGAGIAASVPITEAEKQAMGEASDFVREKVGEATAEVTNQIKEAADAALSEVKAQGITPDTVTEAVGVMRNKMSGEKAVKERTTGSTAANSSRGNSGAGPRKT
jgi:hypothetical protein